MPANGDGIKVSVGEGRWEVWCKAVFLGEDLIITVGGGEKDHVGSVVISIPRKSRARESMLSVTSSVFNVSGHKDEVIIREVAEKACMACGCVVVCAGGVHVDNADERDIEMLVRNGKKLAELVANRVKNWSKKGD